MGSVFEQIEKSRGRGNVEQTALADHAERWPELAALFAGKLDEAGRWAIGPTTLMIWAEGGHIKFCLSPKFCTTVGFYTVSDPEHVFDSVEHAIVAQKVDWRTRNGK